MSRLARSLDTLRQHLVTVGAETTPSDSERGDVPGWVLVTLMTAGLVTLLWQTAGPLLTSLFTNAMNSVSG